MFRAGKSLDIVLLAPIFQFTIQVLRVAKPSNKNEALFISTYLVSHDNESENEMTLTSSTFPLFSLTSFD
jgi:hypothetical protein